MAEANWLIKGCRVMAYDWADDRLGRATVLWVGRDYVRVVLDVSGKRVVVRRDKCKRLVRRA